MKCTETIKTGNFIGNGQGNYKLEEAVCDTEMIKKGELDNYSLGLEVQSLYQCPKCKNIEIN